MVPLRGVLTGVSVLQLWACLVAGHGRLVDPPSRSSMWRYGFKTAVNYDDNQLYCGGVQVQYEQNGGKCGVCGDPWQGPRENEPGGKYAKGIIVRKYEIGEVIEAVVDLTASHKGYFQFKLCENDDPSKKVTQSCFDRHVLKIADSNEIKYKVPDKTGGQNLRVKLQLPPNVKCRACVFQWKYNAGNSWGVDPGARRGCLGCGNQEQFYGCADVAIGYKDVVVGEHSKLPADKEEDGKDKDEQQGSVVPDYDHYPSPPPIPDWNRVPDKDETEAGMGESGSDGWGQGGDRGWGESGPGGGEVSDAFEFLPGSGGNMSPCMCVCRKSPVKLFGGAGKDIAVQFFEGMDDKQVCMCMCQNSGTNLQATPLLCCMAVLHVLLTQYWLNKR